MHAIDDKTDLDISIRHSQPSDAALLAELGAQAFRDAFAADLPEADVAEYLIASFTPERLAAQITDRLTLLLIAESDAEAIGYAYLNPSEPPRCVNGPDPVQLERLYLLKPWYGRGVGNLLMRACLSEARQRGYRTIWLSSWELNTRANSFYSKWRFEPVGTIQCRHRQRPYRRA